jgi:hypothetical protein
MSLSNETSVAAEDASTMCSDKVSSVGSQGSNSPVDVPHLGGGILYGYVVSNLDVGQVTSMLIVPHPCVLLHFVSGLLGILRRLLPLECEQSAVGQEAILYRVAKEFLGR